MHLINNNSEQIRIVIAGDFCPIGLTAIDKQGILGDLRPIFDNSDLNIVNLECPLTLSTQKIKKSGPHLKAAPENIELLKQTQINLVTLANNHLMDYCEEGYYDTIRVLEQNGIGYVGVGANLLEAGEPKYIEVKGKRIVFLNFSAIEFSIANEKRCGANPINIINNYHQIIEAKAESDYQIVIVHAGIEQYAFPTPNLQKLFRFYASLGVSAVIGHHSHCISGYEVYKGVPIFYSLGNFVFYEPGNLPSWYDGLVLELSIDNTGSLSYKTHCCRQEINKDSYQLRLIETCQPEKINTEMVNRNWYDYLSKKPLRRNILNNILKRNLWQRALNKFFLHLLEKKIDVTYLNLLRYETSYEYIINVLEDIVGENN